MPHPSTPPEPLPDAVVLLSLVGSLLLCFALVFIAVGRRPADPPLQWRQPLPTRVGAPQAQVPIWTA
ncbi:MAG: hypothetical protein ACKOCM_08110 [Cyanobacteriota bacterium]